MSVESPLTGVADTLTFRSVDELVGTALKEMAFPVPVSDRVSAPVPTSNTLPLPLLVKVAAPDPPEKVLPLPLPVKL